MFQTRSVEKSADLIEALLNKKFLPKISNAKLQTIDWSARKNRPSAHKVSQIFCAINIFCGSFIAILYEISYSL